VSQLAKASASQVFRRKSRLAEYIPVVVVVGSLTENLEGVPPLQDATQAVPWSRKLSAHLMHW
jgi:hypothetical protein